MRWSDEQRQDFQRRFFISGCLPDTNSRLRPLTSLQSSASVPADFVNLVSLNQYTGSLSARFQRRFYPPTKTHSRPHQKQTSGRLKSPWEVKVQAADTRNTQRNSVTAKCLQWDVQRWRTPSLSALRPSVSSHSFIIKAPPPCPKNTGENVTRVFKCFNNSPTALIC